MIEKLVTRAFASVAIICGWLSSLLNRNKVSGRSLLAFLFLTRHWLCSIVSSIDRAPNDTVFLGRCSLLKSVQSFENWFRLWHVTYVKMIRAINAKYDGLWFCALFIQNSLILYIQNLMNSQWLSVIRLLRLNSISLGFPPQLIQQEGFDCRG